MAREKNRKKNSKKKRRKRRKYRKLYVSTAAFITAAVVIVFCIYYVYYETSYFNLTEVQVVGNNKYDSNYIREKSRIDVGSKLFSVDREKVKDTLEEEIYVKSARVIYELPNKILIELIERAEKYQIFFNNEYIITDEEGIVLDITKVRNELITIESLVNVLYNVGETIKFADLENTDSFFATIDYINSEFGDGVVKKISIDSSKSFLLETEYGTFIKIKMDEDIKYQIGFAMKIINDRLNNNLTVNNGLIDFTKGDSPVYVEDFKMEE